MYQAPKPNRQVIVISALVILLVIAVLYIGISKFQSAKNADIQRAYQNGYNTGLTAAVVAVYQQTNNCQATIITIGNVTRQIVDTSCLTQK
jgi:uncharacterized protein (UPF0333 family)